MKPTNEVLYNMIENLTHNMSEFIKETKEYRDKDEEIKDLILAQVTKTNGRVNVIEPIAFHYRDIFSKVTGAFWVIALLGTSVVGILYYGWGFYIRHLKADLIAEISANRDAINNLTK